jgi:UDP-N-acetylmuramoylalanine--D-glutamate ligase
VTEPTADVAGRHVVVAGLGRSGAAAARALLTRGARVTAVDAATEGGAARTADELRAAGARVELGEDASGRLPAEADLVVVSPGWRPTALLLQDAARLGVPVWGEVELAWRMRGPGAARWLVVTGTNGKTTATRMLEAMLLADGRRAVAAGNIGLPLVSVVTGEERYDVLAVELSSFQLTSVHTTRPYASVVLNVAEDHTDWHGSMQAYAQAKARAYERCEAVAVHNLDEPITGDLLRSSAPAAGCRRVGFTLAAPPPQALGVVDGALVDRAFGAGEVTLAQVDDVRPAAPHNTANALAAAALARAAGVAPAAVAAGLRAFVPEPHRITTVATLHGVTYVDDSKATNPHAAETSLAAYPSVVWVAGGMAKGAEFDDLARRQAGRLRAAVLLGADRDRIAAAIRRHAPGIPVIEVSGPETGDVSVMGPVVRAARDLAVAGDTVLLAPGCASWDQFADYTDRGRQFAQAVLRLRDDSEAAP